MNTTRIPSFSRRRLAAGVAAIAIATAGCSASNSTPSADSVDPVEPIEDDREAASADSTADPVAEPTTPTTPPADSSGETPTDPVGPIDPIDPVTPTVPTDPGEPVPPNVPADPPADPGNTTDPADPPADPADPADPPANPADPPADPGNTTDPADPADPTDPADLGDLVVEVVEAGVFDDVFQPLDPTTEIIATIDHDDLVAINPCGLIGPAGTDYAVSVDVDATGDGTADDVATTFFDTEWRLRLEIAGGPTSQIGLGGQLNPWLKVVDGVRLGSATKEHIVVHDELVGEPDSFNHFFGVDADGCLQPAIISLLEGFTGSWWHSLECGDGGYTKYVRTKWISHDAWELNVTDIRPDGTLAVVDHTMVAGDHPFVEGRGTNNCI